jgi:cyclomaltodextrinase
MYGILSSRRKCMARDTPSWIRQAALYQIYLRNFTPEGTIAAAIPRLGAIRDLGFDIVQLTPIHPIGGVNRKGALGSPYSVRDYRAVDPLLGDIDDLRGFLAAAHDCGLKVVMDVVFNHTARDSILLSEHPEWYLHDAGGGPSRKVADWSDVYDLDFTHPQLRGYLIRSLAGWVEEGIDGFRCDVASLVPLDFWVEARRLLNATRPLVWIAESVERNFVKYLRDAGWYAAADPELHEAFDVTYEYDGFEYLKGYLGGSLALEPYIRHVSLQETMYPSHAVKARFLENHDQPRAAAVFPGRELLENWTAFSMLLPGLIFCYMGQEYALSGRPDLFSRDPVPWSEGSEIFLDFFGRVLECAKRVKAETGIFDLVTLREGVYALRWRSPSSNARYTGLVNLAGKSGTCPVPFALRGTDVLTLEPGGAVAAWSTGDWIPIPRRPRGVTRASRKEKGSQWYSLARSGSAARPALGTDRPKARQIDSWVSMSIRALVRPFSDSSLTNRG